MALKHTLLGLLYLEARTGYDLYKRIGQLEPLVEAATLRQIYPLLRRMADEGLVAYDREPQDGKPDRKVYRVTPRGEAEFMTWLRQPVALEGHSLYPLMLRCFFYGLLDSSFVVEQLEAARTNRRAYLEAFASLKSMDLRIPPGIEMDGPRMMRLWEALFGYGRAEIQMQLHWLEETIAKIDSPS